MNAVLLIDDIMKTQEISQLSWTVYGLPSEICIFKDCQIILFCSSFLASFYLLWQYKESK